MMRYFQKAMRRAEIDMCYSEGFSPHQIMSFAAPLGVGITSDGEYLDIEVHQSPSTEEALRILNETMVEGVEITGYAKLADDARTAMSIVARRSMSFPLKKVTGRLRQQNSSRRALPNISQILRRFSSPNRRKKVKKSWT